MGASRACLGSPWLDPHQHCESQGQAFPAAFSLAEPEPDCKRNKPDLVAWIITPSTYTALPACLPYCLPPPSHPPHAGFY